MNYWYAVQKDCNDDWSYGSYDKEEAINMMNNCGWATMIAVIDGDTCIDEIYKED